MKYDLPFENWRERIGWVCFTCGREYGPQTLKECVAITCHKGRCDVCLDEPVTVTDPRNFGRLKLLSYREWIAKRKMAKIKTSTTTGSLATVGIGRKH